LVRDYNSHKNTSIYTTLTAAPQKTPMSNIPLPHLPYIAAVTCLRSSGHRKVITPDIHLLSSIIQRCPDITILYKTCSSYESGGLCFV